MAPDTPDSPEPVSPPTEQSVVSVPLAVSAPAPGSRSRRWRWLLAILFILLLLAGGSGAGYWALERWGRQPFGEPATHTFKIAPRAASREVGRRLWREGLISNDLAFLAWLRLHGLQHQLQAGDFQLKTPISPQGLIEALRHGRFERALTIPEGWTTRQVAHRLAGEKWVRDERQWLELVARPVAPEFAGLALPHGAEGFCFPDTYRLEVGTRPEEILRRMLAKFRQQWTASQPVQRDERSAALSPLEVIVLAAMIQNEARSETEMPRIASVYLNRLQRHMKMQCCATVRYALGGVWDRPLLYSDLKTSSPYNTYLHPGLPPGPICNPGRAALEAVLRPAHENFLFYVYVGSGCHIYSRTFREHQAAIRAARQRDPQAEINEPGVE